MAQNPHHSPSSPYSANGPWLREQGPSPRNGNKRNGGNSRTVIIRVRNCHRTTRAVGADRGSSHLLFPGAKAPAPPPRGRPPTSAAPFCWPAPLPPSSVAASLLPALLRGLASECQAAAGRPELGFRPKIAKATAPAGSPSSYLSSHSVVSSNFTSPFIFCIFA